MSMEGRMTVCNLSIEMGARGGMIAPDETTFAYLKGKEKAPKGDAWEKALVYWRTLKTDADAKFDRELNYHAGEIEPQITYGTNPGLGTGITHNIPLASDVKDGEAPYKKSLTDMGFAAAKSLISNHLSYFSLTVY